MNMNDAFIGSLIFNKNGGGGASSLEDLSDINITAPQNGQALIYDEDSEKWVNRQGDGAQVALTQAEYDVLVQAGAVDPTTEYFITDGIPSAFTPTITIYNGTKTNNITDGGCAITIVGMGSCNIIQVSGFFKANGTISTVTEYTDLFTFDAAALADLNTLANTVMLAYGADSGFFFCRTCAHAENNAIACFWGTTADKWYSFHQIFIVEK